MNATQPKQSRFPFWRPAMILGLIAGVCLLWILFRETQRIQVQPVNAWTDDQRADCVVVLTGGPGRIREGFDLLARGLVKKLIISGVNPSVRLQDIFPQLPFYGTVSEEDVILEKTSRTTFGNAQQSYPLVEALRCRDVILVTSYLHMYRALRTFEATYPPEVPLYPRATVGGGHPPDFISLVTEGIKSLFYSLWAYQSQGDQT